MARVPGILKRTSKEEQLELELAREASVARLERLLRQRAGLDTDADDVEEIEARAEVEAIAEPAQAPAPDEPAEPLADDAEPPASVHPGVPVMDSEVVAAAGARRPAGRVPLVEIEQGWDPEPSEPAVGLGSRDPETWTESGVDPIDEGDASETGQTPGSRPRSRKAAPPRPPRTLPPGRPVVLPKRAPRRPRRPTVLAACPSCGVLLDPQPTASRRCVSCRERIVLKRLEGGVLFLTASAAAALEAAQRLERELARLARQRDRWLALATTAGASSAAIHRLASTTPSEEGIAAARVFYLQSADRAFAAARKDRRWADAASTRRTQASALQRAAGRDAPPLEDLRGLYRDAFTADLRLLRETGRDATLTAGSCDACRADAGIVVRISEELKAPRLPHAECPRIPCGCRWSVVKPVTRVSRASGGATRRTAAPTRKAPTHG